MGGSPSPAPRPLGQEGAQARSVAPDLVQVSAQPWLFPFWPLRAEPAAEEPHPWVFPLFRSCFQENSQTEEMAVPEQLLVLTRKLLGSNKTCGCYEAFLTTTPGTQHLSTGGVRTFLFY